MEPARRINWFLFWFALFLVMLPVGLGMVTFFDLRVSGHVFAIGMAVLYPFSLMYPTYKAQVEGEQQKKKPVTDSNVQSKSPPRLAFVLLLLFVCVLLADNVARLVRGGGEPSWSSIAFYAIAVPTAALVSHILLMRSLMRSEKPSDE